MCKVSYVQSTNINGRLIGIDKPIVAKKAENFSILNRVPCILSKHALVSIHRRFSCLLYKKSNLVTYFLDFEVIRNLLSAGLCVTNLEFSK